MRSALQFIGVIAFLLGSFVRAQKSGLTVTGDNFFEFPTGIECTYRDTLQKIKYSAAQLKAAIRTKEASLQSPRNRIEQAKTGAINALWKLQFHDMDIHEEFTVFGGMTITFATSHSARLPGAGINMVIYKGFHNDIVKRSVPGETDEG